MIVFLIKNHALVKNTMSDYLQHVRWYLKAKFNLDSDILDITGAPIPAKYTTIIFVQSIDPRVISGLNNPHLQPPGPAPVYNHSIRRPRPRVQSRRTRPTVQPQPTPQPTQQSTQTPPQPQSPRKRQIFLLNTEQVTVKRYIPKIIADIKRYKVPVIDYSLENIHLLRQQLPNTTFIHLPFPPRTNTAAVAKSNFVISLLSSPYRRRIGATLGMPIASFQGKWGVQRDTMIKNSKVLVNIHFSEEYKIFESIRCYHALEMNTLVVSEPSVAMDKVLLKDFIIFVPAGEMAAKLKDIQENYLTYYQRYLSPEAVARMDSLIYGAYETAVEQIKTIS